MTYPTSPAAETAEGPPRLWQISSIPSNGLERHWREKLQDRREDPRSARDLEAKIAALYQDAESVSILGAVVLARIVKENPCSLRAAAKVARPRSRTCDAHAVQRSSGTHPEDTPRPRAQAG